MNIFINMYSYKFFFLGINYICICYEISFNVRQMSWVNFCSMRKLRDKKIK